MASSRSLGESSAQLTAIIQLVGRDSILLLPLTALQINKLCSNIKRPHLVCMCVDMNLLRGSESQAYVCTHPFHGGQKHAWVPRAGGRARETGLTMSVLKRSGCRVV